MTIKAFVALLFVGLLVWVVIIATIAHFVIKYW